MSANNNVEVPILGLKLRLHCPEEQQEALLNSARRLEERVSKLKEQSGIIQIEKVLTIVALNLHYELEQEKMRNAENKNVLMACIEQLDSSLNRFQNSVDDSVLADEETA